MLENLNINKKLFVLWVNIKRLSHYNHGSLLQYTIPTGKLFILLL